MGDPLSLRSIWGYTANGSFADYAVAPASHVAHIPERSHSESLSDTAAAPILCAGVTTWKALKEAEATGGQWIVISGIGGLGQLAIQYAVATGLHVIAVDIDPHKLTVAKDLGAQIVLNGNEPDSIRAVQSSIGGAHAAIVTAVSLSAFRQTIDMLRRKGTCVLVGLPPGEFPVPIFDVVLKRLTIRGSIVGTRNDLAEALSMAVEFGVHSVIQTQPFESINESLELLRAGRADGRIVLTF